MKVLFHYMLLILKRNFCSDVNNTRGTTRMVALYIFESRNLSQPNFIIKVHELHIRVAALCRRRRPPRHFQCQPQQSHRVRRLTLILLIDPFNPFSPTMDTSVSQKSK